MKSARSLLACLLVAAVAAPPAYAASFEEITEAVVDGAFADADAGWRRRVVMRTDSCGQFGDRTQRRIDVLIDGYETLSAAVASRNESAARAAGARFSEIVYANDRFEQCWSEIARRAGVKARIARMF